MENKNDRSKPGAIFVIRTMPKFIDKPLYVKERPWAYKKNNNLSYLLVKDGINFLD